MEHTGSFILAKRMLSISSTEHDSFQQKNRHRHRVSHPKIPNVNEKPQTFLSFFSQTLVSWSRVCVARVSSAFPALGQKMDLGYCYASD